MNKNYTRIIAVALSGLILASGTAALAYSDGIGTAEADTQAATTTTAAAATDAKAAKDETVYVIAGADGSVKKIIVSDWIKNNAKADTVTDTGALENVTNVKGDETYTMNKDNMRVWNADGKDIYAQGESTKALPVDLSISYQLDGVAVSPDELAGKSGKVTMRFDYQNNQYAYAEIDGKREKIYVPFLMLSGMLLDSDRFSNVQVTNGKVIGDGDKMVVVGFALPGLQENLKIDKTTFDIPNSVEITADVKDFALETTMTLATNEALNSLDLSKVDSLDSLQSSMNKLTDSMKQLMDGSSILYNGMQTLLNKCDDLVQGVNALTAGANQVSAGAAEVSDGVGALREGVNTLYSSVNGQLTSQNGTLTAGAKQVFDQLLATVRQQLLAKGLQDVPELTVDNYQAVLTGIQDGLRKRVTDAVRANVLTQVLTFKNIPADYYKSLPANDATKLAIDGTVDAQMKTADVQAAITANLESSGAKAGIEAIETAKASLDGYNQLYTGILSYTSGVSQVEAGLLKAYDNSAELQNGAKAVAGGAKQVSDGLNAVQAQTPALTDGVKQLTNGSMQLSEGLKQFNAQGVKKLADAVNGDLGGLVARLKATVDVSKSYTSFTGTANGTDGNVKFIYKTDSIKK